MTFCEGLPYTVKWSGRRWRIRPAFDNVLCALRTLDDTDLPPDERRNIALAYLMDGDYRNADGLLNAVLETLDLVPKQSDKPKGERALDLYLDTPYIYAAFMQAYGIDLYEQRGKLHWLKFHALLSSIPQCTRLSDIMQIRTREVPAPTKNNAKQREEIIRAKACYKLPVSEAESRAEFENAFRGLIASYEKRGDI